MDTPSQLEQRVQGTFVSCLEICTNKMFVASCIQLLSILGLESVYPCRAPSMRICPYSFHEFTLYYE